MTPYEAGRAVRRALPGVVWFGGGFTLVLWLGFTHPNPVPALVVLALLGLPLSGTERGRSRPSVPRRDSGPVGSGGGDVCDGGD
jgi:hypothetical protein